MAVEDYNTTANASPNNASPYFPEGMNPSAVNDASRQLMADVKAYSQEPWWASLGSNSGDVSVTYVSGTSFTISGDVTSLYHQNRRIRVTGSTTGTIYGQIASSSHDGGSGLTTVTITFDSGSMSNEALTVRLGLPFDNPPFAIGDNQLPASVTGMTSLADVETITGSALDITGLASLAGTSVAVTGLASLAGTAFTLNSVGSITGNSLSVSGISSLLGTGMTINSVGTLTGSSLSITGIASLAGSAFTLNSVSAITGSSLDITGVELISGLSWELSGLSELSGTLLDITGVETINAVNINKFPNTTASSQLIQSGTVVYSSGTATVNFPTAFGSAPIVIGNILSSVATDRSIQHNAPSTTQVTFFVFDQSVGAAAGSGSIEWIAIGTAA